MRTAWGQQCSVECMTSTLRVHGARVQRLSVIQHIPTRELVLGFIHNCTPLGVTLWNMYKLFQQDNCKQNARLHGLHDPCYARSLIFCCAYKNVYEHISLSSYHQVILPGACLANRLDHGFSLLPCILTWPCYYTACSSTASGQLSLTQMWFGRSSLDP